MDKDKIKEILKREGLTILDEEMFEVFNRINKVIWKEAQKELLEEIEKEMDILCKENEVHRNEFEDSGDLKNAEGYESGLYRARTITYSKLKKLLSLENIVESPSKKP